MGSFITVMQYLHEAAHGAGVFPHEGVLRSWMCGYGL